jgi:hypothetical protein
MSLARMTRQLEKWNRDVPDYLKAIQPHLVLAKAGPRRTEMQRSAQRLCRDGHRRAVP